MRRLRAGGSSNCGFLDTVFCFDAATGEEEKKELLKTARFFCACAKQRIDHLFADVASNNDRDSYSLARTLLGFDRK